MLSGFLMLLSRGCLKQELAKEQEELHVSCQKHYLANFDLKFLKVQHYPNVDPNARK